MLDIDERGSKEGWGKGEGWGQMEWEGVVLLGSRRPWALIIHRWGVVVGHVHYSVGGCLVCGRSSCTGGTLLSMGRALSSVGDPSRLWAHGGSRPWVGALLCPWGRWVVVLFVGDGRCLWVLGVVCGHWVFVSGRWVVDCRRWGSFTWSGSSWPLVCCSWAWW